VSTLELPVVRRAAPRARITRCGPVRLAVPGRTLLLVAGMPGAGKSTLLASLPWSPNVVVLDSDDHRRALADRLPGVPYDRYRPLVHLRHRLDVVRRAASSTPTVVVHLPATDAVTRAAVALLAALTGRTAHLLWLHVDPADARQGQRDRGRLVPSSSFAGHAERAAATTANLLRSATQPGWASVTVVDRAAARHGLRLATGDVAA
jgi:predicted kinase